MSLETSTKVFSLAISKDEEILRFRNIRTERILESSIIGAIDELLAACALNLDKVDCLAVGLGPGSFTSLRVGLSTVKAFALATDKKVVGVGSLDIIASGVANQKADEICVVVDAKRGKVYAAIYNRNLTRQCDYLLATIDDVLEKVRGETLFVGDGLGLYKEHIERFYQNHSKNKPIQCRSIFTSEKLWYPHSKELAKLSFRKLINKEFQDPAKIVPVYLYPEDCQVDQRRRR